MSNRKIKNSEKLSILAKVRRVYICAWDIYDLLFVRITNHGQLITFKIADCMITRFYIVLVVYIVAATVVIVVYF